MSNPLAIGAVSAVLRNLLDNGLIDVGSPLGSVKVSSIAPDLVRLDDPDAPPSLNLFLYRITPNQGWRNEALPSYGGDGSRLTDPPLALNLHYLLTAYGSADFHAEILLGYATFLLHQHPVLNRAAIRRALDPSPLGPSILPPAYQALTAADLADQVESLTVTPEPMDTEQMSRLWSALQAHYRPTAGYVVSVVLIEAARPARKPLPVLSRGPVDPASGRDRGVTAEPALLPPFPTVTALTPPAGQVAVLPGQAVRIRGHHLDGTSVTVHLHHPLLGDPLSVPVGTVADRDGFDLVLPSGPAADAGWPAGVWAVSVDVVRPGETVARTSGIAPMLLAPHAELPPAAMIRDPVTGTLVVTLHVHPEVRPAQRVTLALGGDVCAADAHPTQSGTLTFRFGALPAGPRWLRLTVDGVESLLVDLSTTPPSFRPTESVNVPP